MFGMAQIKTILSLKCLGEGDILLGSIARTNPTACVTVSQ